MLKRLFRISFFILIVVIVTAPVYGVEFQPIGFEALSMGGAGVASSRGIYASYYNPALLAKHKHGTQISLSAGIGIREINIAQHLDTLSDIGID